MAGMYGFKAKDGGPARVDPHQVRSILPSGGGHTGYSKLVLDGGHSVVVEGDVDYLHDLVSGYVTTPNAPGVTEKQMGGPPPQPDLASLGGALGGLVGAVRENGRASGTFGGAVDVPATQADYERVKKHHDDGVKAALRAMIHSTGGGQAWEAVKQLLSTEDAEAMQREAEHGSWAGSPAAVRGSAP